MTDPRDDKLRIEHTKGGLLFDSFRWILENSEFQEWRCAHQSSLLWIKGDAGKGKTMLLIGIINELLQKDANTKQSSGAGALYALSYFLCQGTDSRLNNATAILRGLIYLLILQQPLLISYLREKYDHTGRKLFDDANAFFSLSEIFRRMLQDPGLQMVYLIVDALDECDVGLQDILRLITQTTSERPTCIKWLVSSRYQDEIEQMLGANDLYTRLSLELNADHISHAVNVYIDYKVSELISLKRDKTLRKQVKEQIRHKSDGTFLWVALAFEELQRALKKNIPLVLNRLPKGLTPLYGRMIEQVQKLEDEYPPLCFLILSIATFAYRPLHILEMLVLQEEMPDWEDLERVVSMCGSLLTIRDKYIYFIHQSAKEYVTRHASAVIFPEGPCSIHHNIFRRSLQALSSKLQRNIYNLQDAGAMVKDIEAFRPDPDPLTAIRYCCTFWLDHLLEVDQSFNFDGVLTDNGATLTFFTKHFLHWLESLSLIGECSHGVLMLRKLLHRVQV